MNQEILAVILKEEILAKVPKGFKQLRKIIIDHSFSEVELKTLLEVATRVESGLVNTPEEKRYAQQTMEEILYKRP